MAALFVKDLHPAVSEVILFNRFSPAGHIQSVRICRDWKTGSPLGYAYINFRYRDDADRAIDMFNFELLLGRPMRVMWSNRDPSAKPIKGGNIFIKNLDWSIDCISLFDTFSVFGRVVSCKVVESKRYGYVQYESAEAAELAIERLNGKMLNDRQVTIEYFKSWEERKVEARKARKRRTMEHKVEACKAKKPKIETRLRFQHQGNKILVRNIDHTLHRKILRRVLTKNISPKLHQPELPPFYAKDTVQTSEASALKIIINTAASKNVQTDESPAPEDNMKTFETTGPEDFKEAVKTPVTEGTVEAVETTTSDDQVESTETASLEKTLEAVETAVSKDKKNLMRICSDGKKKKRKKKKKKKRKNE